MTQPYNWYDMGPVWPPGGGALAVPGIEDFAASSPVNQLAHFTLTAGDYVVVRTVFTAGSTMGICSDNDADNQYASGSPGPGIYVFGPATQTGGYIIYAWAPGYDAGLTGSGDYAVIHPWATSTYYRPGSVIVDTGHFHIRLPETLQRFSNPVGVSHVSNFHTSAPGFATDGSFSQDGTYIVEPIGFWKDLGTAPNFSTLVQTWQANHSYPVPGPFGPTDYGVAVVQPSIPNGHRYISDAGFTRTTGPVEPIWPTQTGLDIINILEPYTGFMWVNPEFTYVPGSMTVLYNDQWEVPHGISPIYNGWIDGWSNGRYLPETRPPHWGSLFLGPGYNPDFYVQCYGGDPTTGTFTVAFRGATTPDLAWDITMADLLAALEALSTIGVGNIDYYNDLGDIITDNQYLEWTMIGDLGYQYIPVTDWTVVDSTDGVVVMDYGNQGIGGMKPSQPGDFLALYYTPGSGTPIIDKPVPAFSVDVPFAFPGWTQVAAENTDATVPSGTRVRFGVDVRWVEKTISGTFTCDIAEFGSNPSGGTAKTCQIVGHAAQFTDLSSNTPTSWFWDFGDGVTSTEQNPLHVFPIGEFDVELSAINAGGSQGPLVKTKLVLVPDPGARATVPDDGFVFSDIGTVWPPPLGAWRPNTYYPPGSVIIDSNGDTQVSYPDYVGMSGPDEPIWSWAGSYTGDSTTNQYWFNIGAVQTGPEFDASGYVYTWEAGSSYNGYDSVAIVKPLTPNGHYYAVDSNYGWSGATEPEWGEPVRGHDVFVFGYSGEWTLQYKAVAGSASVYRAGVLMTEGVNWHFATTNGAPDGTWVQWDGAGWATGQIVEVYYTPDDTQRLGNLIIPGVGDVDPGNGNDLGTFHAAAGDTFWNEVTTAISIGAGFVT